MSRNHGRENESIQSNDSQEEFFTVEKVIDVKRVGEGEDGWRYRIRWKGYGPDKDTWEPPSHFDGLVLEGFKEHYENLKKERAALLQESGQDISAEDIVDVNVLSREIEDISSKIIDGGAERRTFYKVKWLGHKKTTWVADTELIHAQDKVDAFLHKKRVEKVRKKPRTCSQDDLSSHEKRVKDREFFEAVQRGAIPMDVDLYSRVKGRRDNRKEQASSSKASSSKRRKRIIQIDSSDETSDGETKGAGKHIGSHINPGDTTEENVQDCAGSVEVEILSGVSLFDPQKSQQEFKRLEQQILALSEEEFMAAVDQDDYPALLASLRSDYIPVLEYSALFLKAARRGSRGIALLLATRVKDLSVRDEYGNSAICMAAEQGDICFAHHLFAMGVSKHECNGADETLQKIASKYGFRHFIRFLQRCEK